MGEDRIGKFSKGKLERETEGWRERQTEREKQRVRDLRKD